MAPSIVKNHITAIGKADVVVTTEMLQATSTGIAEAQLLFTVNSLPSQGGLKLNGTALVVNGTFTQADITAGKLTYLPSGTTATTDGFGFTVTDGTSTPATSTAGTKIIFSPEFSSTISALQSAFTNAVFSADGRYILASTDSSTTGNQINLFLYDLQNTTIDRVGVFTTDPKSNTPFAKNFDISGDGRYITFQSDAITLTGDTDTAPSPDIFLFDRQTGINKIVSIGSTGTKLARKSQLPTISKDGRYIAFESQAPNLVSTTTTNINPGIFVYDRQADSLARVSLDSQGQVAQSGYAVTPAISANGRYVVFTSNAALLPSDLNSFGIGSNIDDVFIRDLQTGTTEKISVSSSGVTGDKGSGDDGINGKIYGATISGDGRYVAFTSRATNLVAGDTNGMEDIFVRDRQTGTTQRVSLDKDGNQVSNLGGYSSSYLDLQLSEDGRYLSFASNTPNLVAGDTFFTHEVFIRDLQTGSTTRVVDYNVNTDVNGGVENRVAVSRDARYVAYKNLDIVPPGYRTNNLYFTDRGGAGSINSTTTTAAIAITPEIVVKPNSTPIASSIAAQNIIAGNALNFALPANTFTDPDAGDVLSYSAKLADGSNLPTWLTFNAATSTFAGTPAAGDVGNLNIAVTATDQAGSAVASNFAINITGSTTPPPTKTNNPATIDGLATLTLNKDPNAAELKGAGKLNITDIDPGEDKFTTSYLSKPGNIGYFTIDSTGNFNYQVANSAIASIGSGTTKHNIFTVMSVDGTASKDIDVAIVGADSSTPVVATSEPNNPVNISPIPGLTVSNNLFTTAATIKGFGVSAISQKLTNKVNEIGVFAVDDLAGKIGSFAPGSAGYLKAVLDIAKPIFTTLAGDFLNTANQEFSIDPNKIYQFFEIQDGSIGELKQQIASGKTPTNLLFSLPDANGNSPIKVTSNSNNDGYKVSVNADELVLNVVKLAGANVNSSIGSKSQSAPEGRTIDLTDYAGQNLKADLTTTSSAAYANHIGFYVVEDSIGTIKLANGSFVKPGDANYALEAIKNALTNSLQTGKTDSKLDQNIAGGRIYAPVVVTQGTFADFVSRNPSNGGGANDIHAYFNYLGANSDKVDHFRLIGNNTFGVEDMYGGGDRDFNDLVVKMKVTV